MPEGRRCLGVFGGSFNPPHLGHLVMASQIQSILGLDKVLFVPAAAPPHKVVDDDTPADVRLAMTRLAIAGDPRFEASDVELERGLSYTLDTVAELRQRHEGSRLYFLMGSDSLLQFDTWHQPTAILQLCRLAVAARPGHDLSRLDEIAAGYGRDLVLVLRTTPIGIASREVRDRVRAGASIRYLVPPAVEDFVLERGLYVAS